MLDHQAGLLGRWLGTSWSDDVRQHALTSLHDAAVWGRPVRGEGSDGLLGSLFEHPGDRLGGAIAVSSQDVGPNLKAAAEHDDIPINIL